MLLPVFSRRFLRPGFHGSIRRRRPAFPPPEFLRLAPLIASPCPQGMWVVCFCSILVNYFVIVFFNVALVSAAPALAGGHATITTDWKQPGDVRGKFSSGPFYRLPLAFS